MTRAAEIIARSRLTDKRAESALTPELDELRTIAVGTGHARALRELGSIERDFEKFLHSGEALVAALTSVGETPLYRGMLAYLAQTGTTLSLQGEPLGLTAKRAATNQSRLDPNWSAELDRSFNTLERQTLELARLDSPSDTTLRAIARCHHAIRDFHTACLAVEQFHERYGAEVRGSDNLGFELDDLLKRVGYAEIRATVPVLNRPGSIPNPAITLVFTQRAPTLASEVMVARDDSVPHILARTREFLLSERSPTMIRELKRLTELARNHLHEAPVELPAAALRPDPATVERTSFVQKIPFLHEALGGDFERFVDTVGRKTGFRQANDRLKALTRACRGSGDSIETILGNDPTILTAPLKDFNRITERLHRGAAAPTSQKPVSPQTAHSPVEADLEAKLCAAGIDGPLAIATVKWGFCRRGHVFHGNHQVSRDRAIDFTATKMPVDRATISACIDLLERRGAITSHSRRGETLSLAPRRSINDPLMRELVGYALDFWSNQRKG